MKKRRTFIHRVSDGLTKSFGTPIFLIFNLLIFITWMIINSGIHPQIIPFDPYPHIFLITFVSLEAIVLTVIVLITQNRQSQIDSLRNELQLQVELITEKEISKILYLLKILLEKNGEKIDDPELEEMIGNLDMSYIQKKLEEQMGS